MTVDVTDQPELNQYQAREDGRLLGLLTYHRTPGQISFDHIEVEPDARGRGIGDLITTAAFADLAGEPDTTVVPACPFIRRWVRKHPEHLPRIATRTHPQH